MSFRCVRVNFFGRMACIWGQNSEVSPNNNVLNCPQSTFFIPLTCLLNIFPLIASFNIPSRPVTTIRLRCLRGSSYSRLLFSAHRFTPVEIALWFYEIDDSCLSISISHPPCACPSSSSSAFPPPCNIHTSLLLRPTLLPSVGERRTFILHNGTLPLCSDGKGVGWIGRRGEG
jgi:hypothetical protein